MIWNKEIKEFTLSKLTAEDVEDAEQLLGVKLPEAYLKLMFEQNGGIPVHRDFPCDMPNSWAEDHVRVDTIYGIGKEGILLSSYLIQEWELPEDIVIFSGDGHGWVAMDYRQKTDDPPIIWVESDQDLIIELASNFAGFVEGLYTAPDEEIEVDDAENIAFAIERVEQLFDQDEASGWVKAFNMLYDHTAGHEIYIQKKIIQLLNGQNIHLKQLAYHYTMIYNEKFSFSASSMKLIYKLMEQDAVLSSEVKVLKNYLTQLDEMNK